MNANEVNEVINNICEKIGIGINNVKEFVPVFAKYKAIDSALSWLGFLAITVIFIILARKAIEAYKEADYMDRDIFGFAVGGSTVVALICGCGSLCNLFDMIKWIIVPEAMTVQYILNMIK